MNPQMFIGAVLNSALYLVCVFIAGMVTGNPWAWKLALASVGVSYFCYCAQLRPVGWGSTRETVAFAFFGLSVALGVFAGVALLIH